MQVEQIACMPWELWVTGDAARQTLAEDEFGLGSMVAALAETLSRRMGE